MRMCWRSPSASPFCLGGLGALRALQQLARRDGHHSLQAHQAHLRSRLQEHQRNVEGIAQVDESRRLVRRVQV